MESDGRIFELKNHLSEHLISLPTIQTILTKLLVGKVFVGEYAERHYVDSLAAYRDLVVVGPEEADLRKTLLQAIKIVRSALKYNIWFGVTGNEHDRTPKGYCLWVNLWQIPLGKHWFQIESINLQAKEILLKLKHLRSFDVKNESNAKETVSAELIDNFDPMKFFRKVESAKVLNYASHSILNASARCILNMKNVLTYKNICETITFSSVLILTIVTLLIESTKFLCDYSIKLMHELSSVIRSLTPIILGIIDFFAKCVGGFFLLIVMLWRGSTTRPPIAVTTSEFEFMGRNEIQCTPQVRDRECIPYARRTPQLKLASTMFNNYN